MPQRPISKDDHRPASLKTLAEYLGLSPATISFVLNDAPNRSIPETTRQRVREAAKKFNYQPSLIARSLQGKRTQTVGVLLPDLGDAYQAEVLSGAAGTLTQSGYLYFTAHHAYRPDLLEQHTRMLSARGVEGFLAIGTKLTTALPWPTVSVGGSTAIQGITDIVLDQDRAAELVIFHLLDLGHQRVAFLRGPALTVDAEPRWQALQKAAATHGIAIDDGLVLQIENDQHSSPTTSSLIERLLRTRRDFTAVVAFDDLSAIACVRALHDAGLQVPRDVSVIGFDDTDVAGFYLPSITSVHQPLREMGRTAAELLLGKITGKPAPPTVKLQPRLIARESTARHKP